MMFELFLNQKLESIKLQVLQMYAIASVTLLGMYAVRRMPEASR
jgi:hypothetical protein